ncbi:hypothetical protein K1719_000416 [Acacia pycnantha]|nr:hypothetical protein K1719_000416 [Acacia pycnantha]
MKDTPEAPAMATVKLENMGHVTRDEWIMIGTMLLAVSLWVFGEILGIPSAVAAMIGLSVLLVLGVLDWNDCLNEKSAWDTLSWFAILVGMSGKLTNLGIVGWMSTYRTYFGLLLCISHYEPGAGVPAVLAALALAYIADLFGSITHYSSGQAAVYYGAGYTELPDIIKIGFIMAFFNAIIW